MPAPHGEEVVVPLGPRSYPVLVGEEMLPVVGPRLAAAGFHGRCGLVTSERVGRLYGETTASALRASGFEPTVVEIPDGEEHKNLACFAAGTLLRGLPLVQVPTTLLAQVDAGIGGKTGVNHALGKYLIGVFHQPEFVVADVGVLRTLPRRELVAGLAEVIKYGVIMDETLFDDVEAHLDDLLALHGEVLVRVVATCARHKAAVVAADEREERGGRAVLNFGHTVGHALEALTEYRQFLHGEAVAIGMVAAARVSRALGCCDASTVARIEHVLTRAGLPTALPSDIAPEALALGMQADKKRTGGRIRFVAVEAIGRVRLVELTPGEIVSRL